MCIGLAIRRGTMRAMLCTKHQIKQKMSVQRCAAKTTYSSEEQEAKPWRDGMETSNSKKHLCDVHRARRVSRRLLAAALLVAATTGVVALALFLVYRPVKPQVTVARAAVYRLASTNSSALPYALSASMQFTLLLHNPSDRAAVFYDGLVAYAAYRGELVIPPARLPAVVQERGADVSLSPLLGGGAAVPVSADAVRALTADCAARRVQLRLVVIGRVRYRTGPFRSGWRDLYVRCDAVVGLTVEAAAGGGAAGDVPLLQYPHCAVDA